MRPWSGFCFDFSGRIFRGLEDPSYFSSSLVFPLSEKFRRTNREEYTIFSFRPSSYPQPVTKSWSSLSEVRLLSSTDDPVAVVELAGQLEAAVRAEFGAAPPVVARSLAAASALVRGRGAAGYVLSNLWLIFGKL